MFLLLNVLYECATLGGPLPRCIFVLDHYVRMYGRYLIHTLPWLEHLVINCSRCLASSDRKDRLAQNDLELRIKMLHAIRTMMNGQPGGFLLALRSVLRGPLKHSTGPRTERKLSKYQQISTVNKELSI